MATTKVIVNKAFNGHKPGDEIVVHVAKAKRLVDAGVCKRPPESFEPIEVDNGDED